MFFEVLGQSDIPFLFSPYPSALLHFPSLLFRGVLGLLNPDSAQGSSPQGLEP